MTLQQIREDLREIRYYYAKQKEFEQAARCGVGNKIVDKIVLYNKAIASAPMKLYDLYIALYVQNNSLVAVADDWDYSDAHMKWLSRQLNQFLLSLLSL